MNTDRLEQLKQYLEEEPNEPFNIYCLANEYKNGVQFIIGPYDDYAIARAIELKESNGATVTVLNIGLVETEPTIRKALAIGADDAIRVNAEPIDSLFVANQIATVAKDNAYDMILMGRESIDFNGGQVHGMVGELLNIPSISPVTKLDLDGTTAKMTKEIEGGKESIEVDLPFVAGCQEPIAEWKIPNMRGIMTARSKPLNVIEPVEIGVGTEVIKFDLPQAKGAVKIVDNVEELVSLLKNEAKVLSYPLFVFGNSTTFDTRLASNLMVKRAIIPALIIDLATTTVSAPTLLNISATTDAPAAAVTTSDELIITLDAPFLPMELSSASSTLFKQTAITSSLNAAP